MEVKAEVVEAYKFIEQGGCGCPDLGPDLLFGGAVVHDLQVRDVGHDTAHGEDFGRVPP